MNTANRARIARKRAQRLGLRLSQRGFVFTLRDENDVTLSVGPLGKVDAYLLERSRPRPPGPAPTLRPSELWRAHIDDYLLTLAAAGQRPATLRLRRALMPRRPGPRPPTQRGHCREAGELAWPPTASIAGRPQKLPQGVARILRLDVRNRPDSAYLGDALPKVRVPHADPRPTSDVAWEAALSKSDARTELMLRLAAECGLRRSEVAAVHSRDLIDVGYPQLLVNGKGGRRRTIPISDYLAALIRDQGEGWLFPNRAGSHLTGEHVGKLVARALPDNWTMHTLRHRFATLTYRGSRNLRAVQTLMGHASIFTTEDIPWSTTMRSAPPPPAHGSELTQGRLSDRSGRIPSSRCGESLREHQMPTHHPSRSWRGCAMCKPHKRRGAGRASKDPAAVKRQLGLIRGYSRRTLERG
jgi:hypothetical protein